jgi:hypothetical protein
LKIKIGDLVKNIPDEQWRNYLSNSLIKGDNKKPDNSKIKKINGIEWYLDY